MRWPIRFILLVLTATVASRAGAAEPTAADGTAFFEKAVRPLLVEQCYSCHSVSAGKAKGGLQLDTRASIAKGGNDGAVIVPGDPDKSRLITAVRWSDPNLQMPPKRKLDGKQIEALEQWVRMGAPDPRDGAASPLDAAKPATAKRVIDIEAGRKWWSFQPVAEAAPPVVQDANWPRRKIDSFILAGLEAQRLAPSPQADDRTLAQRAYLDLTGLRASYDEVEAYVHDASPDKYPKLVDNLLQSPHYGERWGRYWLDVARYGEDNPTTEATNPPYPYAWRYRDWVIKSLNADVPYDRFVKLQLAADQVAGATRDDFAALTFLGAGPVYHKDGRLSRDVIETLYTDDWDERVDTVTRGVLGLTVACARCHDHKFDPITSADYYALAGVFASTVQVPRPLATNVDPKVESAFMFAYQRLFYLSYMSSLLRGDPGSKPAEARVKVEHAVEEIVRMKSELLYIRDAQPAMYALLDRVGRLPDAYPGKPWPKVLEPANLVADAVLNRNDTHLPGGGGGGAEAPAPATKPSPAAGGGNGNQAGVRQFGFGRRRGGSTEPFVNGVFDAGVWIDGADADFTWPDVRPNQPRDLPIFAGGSVTKAGAASPRRFVSVLSHDDAAPFSRGSGRLDLAERMFTDGAPLAARVIVNRVWGYHFGKPLVATQSDFGAQGDKPTHPALLDDLAARFIKSGWSLKWLHREIMLSAAYRQSSHPRDDGIAADATNRLLWRMNPRRLDVEAFRDALLQAGGNLDLTAGGPSQDVDQPENFRRTVYARIGRGRVSPLLQLFDFPETTMHSPGREATTTPLQQLFVMNSPFVRGQANAIAQSVAKEADDAAQVRAMYRRVLSRDPTDAELHRAADFFATGAKPVDFAHALLTTNEVIFWP